jgi:hypothetical protein
MAGNPWAATRRRVRVVVDAHRRAHRLLAVKLSCRCTVGMRAPPQKAASTQFGEIQTLEQVFHNVQGIDKPWFFSPAALARYSDINMQGRVAGRPA